MNAKHVPDTFKSPEVFDPARVAENFENYTHEAQDQIAALLSRAKKKANVTIKFSPDGPDLLFEATKSGINQTILRRLWCGPRWYTPYYQIDWIFPYVDVKIWCSRQQPDLPIRPGSVQIFCDGEKQTGDVSPDILQIQTNRTKVRDRIRVTDLGIQLQGIFPMPQKISLPDPRGLSAENFLREIEGLNI